jgi:hypothetical protein
VLLRLLEGAYTVSVRREMGTASCPATEAVLRLLWQEEQACGILLRFFDYLIVRWGGYRPVRINTSRSVRRSKAFSWRNSTVVRPISVRPTI